MPDTSEDILVVPLLKEVIEAMEVDGISDIYFRPGRPIQIVQQLIINDESITLKDNNYPFFGVFTPLRIQWESESRGLVKIPLISIAALSNQNKPVIDRYDTGDNFKSILNPLRKEFFIQISQHINVVNNDPENFDCTWEEYPGVQESEHHDFVDCINILDLKFYIHKFKTCQ